MSDGCLVGLDIGTSSVKAAVFDAHGRLLAHSAAALTVSSPHPGWAEQTPHDWWQGALVVLREVFESVDPSQIIAIGLAGQCPGHVLMDAEGNSLGPAIIWRDSRAREEAAWLQEHVSPGQAKEWVATEFLGDATAPPARLLWLKKHRHAEWNKTASVLEPKDYMAARLTGNSVTDLHSAYCLVHPESGDYDLEYFRFMGIPIEKMPRALLPTEIAGKVTKEASLSTGLQEGTPVVIGTIDAYCDNLAGGAIFPGRAVDVAGTSEIVSLGIKQTTQAAGVFPARIGKDGFFLCGPTQAGGETLRWLGEGFHPEHLGKVNFGKLEEEARSVPAGSNGLIFLPYLSGERAPIWDADAKGSFVGLTLMHTRSHCTRAVYEGVAYAIRHVLETCEAAAGTPAAEIVVCGGASGSTIWNQIKADILQRPVQPTVVKETGCLGAAILAAVGVGIHSDIATSCRSMIALGNAVTPDEAVAGTYEKSYKVYKELYPALKPIFAGLAG